MPTPPNQLARWVWSYSCRRFRQFHLELMSADYWLRCRSPSACRWPGLKQLGRNTRKLDTSRWRPLKIRNCWIRRRAADGDVADAHRRAAAVGQGEVSHAVPVPTGVLPKL